MLNECKLHFYFPALFCRLTAMLAAKPDPVIIFEMPGELTLKPAGWTATEEPEPAA